MNKTPFFSVIMPVYNCEDLVNQAVDNLNKQTVKSFEVIFVNDGSKDNTLEKLNLKLQQATFKYKVLSQENAGPGEARNNGIKCASGNYILFVDADDYLEPNAIEILISNAENTMADVILFGYFQDFYTSETKIDHTVTVVPKSQLLTDNKFIVSKVSALDQNKVFSFACNKAIKRDLILENDIVFSKRMHSEDYFFYIDLFYHVNSLSVIDKPIYHYVKSPRETLTNQPYIKNFYKLITDRYLAMQNILKSRQVYHGEIAANAANTHIKHIFSHFSNNCSRYSGLKGKDIRCDIKATLEDSITKEAIALAQGGSKAQKIMNIILKTNSVWLCFLFAKVICFSRNSKLFDKMK